MTPDYCCNYCDHKFFFHAGPYNREVKCPVCKDRDVKRINKSYQKVDYYPETKAEKNLQHEFEDLISWHEE